MKKEYPLRPQPIPKKDCVCGHSFLRHIHFSPFSKYNCDICMCPKYEEDKP